MAFFTKILVGVDLHRGDRVAAGEPGVESRSAIEEAIVMAGHMGCTVTFCSVLEISPQAARLIEEDHQNLLRTVEDVAREMLELLVAEAAARGISARYVIRSGSPPDELAALATEENFDLVVVGTRARSRASRVLFGSTSQKLIRAAPCAVWITKAEELREIREIALATDMSDAARPALLAAIEVARALGARLYVVHAVDIGELSYLLMAGIDQDEIAAARQRMFDEAQKSLQQQMASTDYRTLQHGVKLEVIEGSPDDAIPKFVAANGIDILVLGSHGRRGFSRLVMGNTAERILPCVECSVIAVKPTDPEAQSAWSGV